MAVTRVLIVGFDPNALPGVDAEAIARGLAHGLERVQAAGCLVEQLLVPLDESAVDRIKRAVVGQAWDVIVIGGGIRKPEPLLEFFETVVNLIHSGAPAARIAFNSDGGSSLEAVQRVLS
ncbi:MULTISPECIES: hypothetical protein [Frankia]|uniref:hypothetical protein n=1 Tax=Frankia TaxID=1854 RepID=UPI0018D3080E|nr:MULTISPECIES: hypothetical protein [Frankia]